MEQAIGWAKRFEGDAKVQIVSVATARADAARAADQAIAFLRLH